MSCFAGLFSRFMKQNPQRIAEENERKIREDEEAAKHIEKYRLELENKRKKLSSDIFHLMRLVRRYLDSSKSKTPLTNSMVKKIRKILNTYKENKDTIYDSDVLYNVYKNCNNASHDVIHKTWKENIISKHCFYNYDLDAKYKYEFVVYTHNKYYLYYKFTSIYVWDSDIQENILWKYYTEILPVSKLEELIQKNEKVKMHNKMCENIFSKMIKYYNEQKQQTIDFDTFFNEKEKSIITEFSK